MDEAPPAEQADQTGRAGVLAGTNVLELAQNLAVPYCGRLLASMGAEVVKVEPPGGDAMRHLATIPGDRESKAYAMINPGKRSACLDLGDQSARPALEALLRWADVVLVSFKPSDVARYGITYEDVCELNPEVVYLENSALGAEGPLADQGGYDILVQALSGLSFVTARSNGEVATSIRPAYNDTGTGAFSTVAVLGALLHKAATGKGQRVRSSLLGTAMAFSTPMTGSFAGIDPPVVDEFRADLAGLRAAGVGFDDQREVYEQRLLPAGGLFSIYFRNYVTADGLVAVGALSSALQVRFHAATGADTPLERDVTFGTDEWTALVSEIEAIVRERTTDQWLERFDETGVPATRYNLPYEALEDPQVELNGYVVDLDHTSFGQHRICGSPIGMDDTPIRIAQPSPVLGADTEIALRAAGMTDEEIAELIAKRSIGATPTA